MELEKNSHQSFEFESEKEKDDIQRNPSFSYIRARRRRIQSKDLGIL